MNALCSLFWLHFTKFCAFYKPIMCFFTNFWVLERERGFSKIYMEASQTSATSERQREQQNPGMRHANMHVRRGKCLFKSLKLSSAYAMFTDIQADVLAQA